MTCRDQRVIKLGSLEGRKASYIDDVLGATHILMCSNQSWTWIGFIIGLELDWVRSFFRFIFPKTELSAFV